MSLVPRYHPLSGVQRNSLIASCVPESPRDAWTWLQQNPKIANKAGFASCLSSSPSQKNTHVLFCTQNQYSSIESKPRVCVLCAWDPTFDSWVSGQHIVLESNIDKRLHYSLSTMRMLSSEQEVKEVAGQVAMEGLVLLSEYSNMAPENEDVSKEEHCGLVSKSVPIPIPPRGHMRSRMYSDTETQAVLLSLKSMESAPTEHNVGF